MLSSLDFFFCINLHPPSEEDFIIIIDITDRIKFLTAFRANKDNFQQSSNACAAYSNIITSRSLPVAYRRCDQFDIADMMPPIRYHYKYCWQRLCNVQQLTITYTNRNVTV